jgi:hypothetical protein
MVWALIGASASAASTGHRASRRRERFVGDALGEQRTIPRALFRPLHYAFHGFGDAVLLDGLPGAGGSLSLPVLLEQGPFVRENGLQTLISAAVLAPFSSARILTACRRAS